ncbi:MAG: hypothetical protein J0I06_26745 [Planctomycetes bacterium]|nr:hypothetical protein [Planctomycetota bacterium]
MRRFLCAAVALLLVTASPAYAGYIIIRVLLEGGGAPTAPGADGAPFPMPMGPGPGPRPGLGFPPPGGMPAGPGMPIGPGAPSGPAGGAAIDPSRSVVIVVPLETDFIHGKLDPSRPKNELTNPDFRKLTAPYYGRMLKASLFIDSSSIQLYEDLIAQPAPRKTRGTQMREKYAAWQRNKNEPQLLYDALILALESGFIHETVLAKDGTVPPDATKIAQELLDLAKEKKPLPADAQKFVDAWSRMADGVRRAAPQPSDAELWRVRLDAATVRPTPHYSVIYWDSPEPEVARRSAQLENHFTAFFLWHATRGIVLRVPDKPLLVALAPQAAAYRKLRRGLDGYDGLPSLSDDRSGQPRRGREGYEGLPAQVSAFYTPEHDLLVLSSGLMDPVGITFQTQNQRYFTKGFSRDRLLEGQIPKIDLRSGTGPTAEEVARASTLAFVEKFVVDDAEIAAVSREGTRQLLFATGGLPRHVTLPNWLTQGALNFYTRPHGPAFVTVGDDQKPNMAVAFTTGYGVPNYVHHRYFKEMGDEFHKELNPDPVKLLEHVLTDAYFTGLKDAIDPDPAPPVKKKPAASTTGMPPGPMGEGPMPPRPVGPMFAGPMGMGAAPGALVTGDEEDPLTLQRRKRERLNIKSQATAWALYYYLARHRPAELQQYIAELNKLPRDLPIDGRTAHTAFVRVFKLSATEDGTADPERMRKFANDWLAYIRIVPQSWIDVPLVVPEPPKGPVGGPMGPMGPMGSPGRPSGPDK